MTVSEILTFVNQLRPNAYEEKLKIQFLNEIENDVFHFMQRYIPANITEKDNIEAHGILAPLHERKPEAVPSSPGTAIADPMNTGTSVIPVPGHYTIFTVKPYTVEDPEAVLLLPDQFTGVYTTYILTKMDYFSQETENYANDALMHQAEYQAFTSWWKQTHMARQPRVGGLT